MTERSRPVVLIVLSGWGIAPPAKNNAIAMAKTSMIDNLIKTYPSMTLNASGEAVGLPQGVISNSEIGHLTLGAGRPVYNKLAKINKAIKDGSFFEQEKLLTAISYSKKNKSSLHLVGLISSGTIHSSIDHLYTLLDLCAKNKFKRVYLHLFLDGRDSPYNSGIDFIKNIKEKIKKLGVGQIATISGRYYGMDRDNHWDRTFLAYKAIVEGKSENQFKDPIEAVESSYDNKIYDEEFVPTIIMKNKKPIGKVANRDSMIFFNFRGERCRQLVKSIVMPSFEKYPRKYLNKLYVVTMTEYDKDLPTEVAYESEIIQKTLPQVISNAGLKQFHVAETENYGHITYFFNGLEEDNFEGEDRILIPSPAISDYNQKPELSAKEIAKKTASEIIDDKYDFIALTFSNCDTLSHLGDLKATIKACEIVDTSIRQIIEVILNKGGVAIITADHGNAEELINLQSGEADKNHTIYPVPLILVGQKWEGKTAGLADAPNSDLSLLQPAGSLVDVAPTILKIMNIKKPKEMTGKSLI